MFSICNVCIYIYMYISIFTHHIDSGFCSREIVIGVEGVGKICRSKRDKPPSFPPSDGFRKLLVSWES